MKNIKNIIFDYGNVIFKIDFAKAQQSFTDLGIKNVDAIFAHAGQNELFDQMDKGMITAAEFRNGVREMAGISTLTDEQIDTAWNSLLVGVPKGNHEVLLRLKNKYRTFLLSNNNEIHYASILAYLQKEYHVEDNSIFFEKDYYSHLMGMRKPDIKIFEFVLNEQILKPEETLFIDDSPQHLKTANSLGMKTLLLNDPYEFISTMKSFEE